MEQILCIGITFLDARFHGKGDGGQPEWPPSPWRLYQSLLAGGNAGCRGASWSSDEAAAMQWLAERGSPRIIAPPMQIAQAYTLWVPNNDHDTIWLAYAKRREPKKSPADLRTAKPVRPVLLLGPPDEAPTRSNTVYWLYPLDNQQDNAAKWYEHIAILRQIASGVHSLGWGVDASIASVSLIDENEAAALPGERWEPVPPGVVTSCMLRTPAPGALDELIRCHESFLHRLEDGVYTPPDRPSEHAFSLTGFYRRIQTPSRPAAAFAVRAADGSEAWFRGNPTLTNRIAAMVRHIACEVSKPDSESRRFPGGSNTYVRGKVNPSRQNPARFSYLPLPTIGHRHADGLIRRVLIAEQTGGDGSHAHWAIHRLRGAPLIDEKSNKTIGILESMNSPDSVTQQYLGPAVSWSTVTPIVLPGFDDGKLKKRDALVLKAVRQAGIPVEAIESFTLRKAPFWPGSQHPWQYLRSNYLKKYPAWHVHLQFREPISGPLAIGAGRHCGLGVFAFDE